MSEIHHSAVIDETESCRQDRLGLYTLIWHITQKSTTGLAISPCIRQEITIGNFSSALVIVLLSYLVIEQAEMQGYGPCNISAEHHLTH